MPAPDGFDQLTNTAAVTGALTANQLLVSVPVPARWVVAGHDVIVTDMDTGSAVTINVGDALDVDRYLAASTIGRDGGSVETRPSASLWHRYALASAVEMRVGAAPGVSTTANAFTLTLYGYPAADYAALRAMVLQELGVLAQGEAPSAPDDELVRQALEETHERARGKMLANRQELAWPLILTPMFAARPYARLAAYDLCAVFGLSAQREAALRVKAAEAERELRRQTMKPSSGDPVNLEPYQTEDVAILDYGSVLQ